MLASSFRRQWAVSLLVISAIALFSLSIASAATREAATEVEFFAAIKSGQAEVKVIPRDSTVLNLMVKNTTDKPLRLEMPPVLAAAPVLAQQPFPNLFQNNNNNNPFSNNNNGGGGNQAVGFPGGQGQNNNNVQFGNPFMNVPARREIKLRLPCVCLEHGKPDANSHVAYELRPLSDFSTDRRVATAIAALSDKHSDQTVVQLAVWNMVNKKTWSDLAAMKVGIVGGITSPRYERRELEQAEALVTKLDEVAAEQTASVRRLSEAVADHPQQ